MIVTEYYMTRADGVVLNRTYSNKGMMIERDGVRYSEAIDPVELNRQYTETDEPISKEYGYDPTEATETDYQSALREMGVKV
jgi:hypothetical protein